MRVAFLILAISLAGCASVRNPSVVVTQPTLASQIPASLRHCRDRPQPGAVETQADVAAFLVHVDEAGQDCRAKLRAIDGVIGDIDAARAKAKG